MKKLWFVTLAILSACTVAPVHTTYDFGAQKTLKDLYERGISEREAQQPDNCLKTFGDLIELRKGVKDSLFVYSLYQSGLCYEMKNKLDKAIAVYQDALRVKGVVPEEFSQLEVPSRLAICYSKMGENKVSDQYYQQSKKYLEYLQKNKYVMGPHREHYAEVLYQMGIITNDFKSGADFESYMKSIRYSQEYLTLAMELGVEPYSHYAAQQLMDHFQNTYNYITQLQPEKADDIVSARANQEEKQRLSAVLSHHLDQFVSFLHEQRQVNSPEYKPLFSKLQDLQDSLTKIIAERPLGEGLTPEAQKLQDPAIKGRLIDVPGESQ
jgi:tetratricopeptide (TPR) repeat protein